MPEQINTLYDNFFDRFTVHEMKRMYRGFKSECPQVWLNMTKYKILRGAIYRTYIRTYLWTNRQIKWSVKKASLLKDVLNINKAKKACRDEDHAAGVRDIKMGRVDAQPFRYSFSEILGLYHNCSDSETEKVLRHRFLFR